MHLAFVEDPENQDIQQRLHTVNKKVAEENITRYYQYLQKKEYTKAYRRLTAAMRQDPELPITKNEFSKWYRILVAGKVEFEFEKIRSNVRLADEMNLFVMIQTPNGEKLQAKVANESGFFFVEDVVYQQAFSSFALYSLHSIGLELTRNPYQMIGGGEDSQAQEELRKATMRGTFSQRNFYQFVTFRNLLGEMSGDLQFEEIAQTKNIIAFRSQMWGSQNLPEWWLPPRSLNYRVEIDEKKIYVSSPHGRNEFSPEAMFLNQDSQRALIDFGNYQLKQDTRSKRWLIRRVVASDASNDYFTLFSKNIALSPYFFYTDGGYQFVNTKAL